MTAESPAMPTSPGYLTAIPVLPPGKAGSVPVVVEPPPVAVVVAIAPAAPPVAVVTEPAVPPCPPLVPPAAPPCPPPAPPAAEPCEHPSPALAAPRTNAQKSFMICLRNGAARVSKNLAAFIVPGIRALGNGTSSHHAAQSSLANRGIGAEGQGCLTDLGGSPRNPQCPEPITSKEGRKAGRKRTSSPTKRTSRWDSSRKS